MVDCSTITLTNVTTSANGNITTTLPKATTVPLVAYLAFNNGVATFYAYPETNYWILHVMQVGNGAALANTTFSSVKVYYLGKL